MAINSTKIAHSQEKTGRTQNISHGLVGQVEADSRKNSWRNHLSCSYSKDRSSIRCTEGSQIISRGAGEMAAVVKEYSTTVQYNSIAFDLIIIYGKSKRID